MARRNKDYRSEFEKKAEERYFEMKTDGTKVRVYDFNLAEKPNDTILFFIPGFSTVFLAWEKVLEPLSKEFRIFYFESREKASSKMPNWRTERRITYHKMAYDMKEVIEQLDLGAKNYVTVSSSAGSTILIEALSEKWFRPNGNVMVGPITQYNMKFIAPFIVSIVPPFFKKIGFPFFKLFMGTVYVNKKKFPEQYAKYIRAGREGSMRKIRKPMWEMRRYQNWDMVPKVESDCLLVGASSDKMHAAEMTLKVNDLMPNSRYVDLGSNKAAHEQPLVDLVKKYVLERNN